MGELGRRRWRRLIRERIDLVTVQITDSNIHARHGHEASGIERDQSSSPVAEWIGNLITICDSPPTLFFSATHPTKSTQPAGQPPAPHCPVWRLSDDGFMHMHRREGVCCCFLHCQCLPRGFLGGTRRERGDASARRARGRASFKKPPKVAATRLSLLAGQLRTKWTAAAAAAAAAAAGRWLLEPLAQA